MEHTETVLGGIDISTRPKRRGAVALIIRALSDIHLQESIYLERIPENLQGGGAHADSEQSLDMLVWAIDCLFDAYDM